MAEDKNTSQVNMKIPGMKGGPRNRGGSCRKACQRQGNIYAPYAVFC